MNKGSGSSEHTPQPGWKWRLLSHEGGGGPHPSELLGMSSLSFSLLLHSSSASLGLILGDMDLSISILSWNARGIVDVLLRHMVQWWTWQCQVGGWSQ